MPSDVARLGRLGTHFNSTSYYDDNIKAPVHVAWYHADHISMYPSLIVSSIEARLRATGPCRLIYRGRDLCRILIYIIEYVTWIRPVSQHLLPLPLRFCALHLIHHYWFLSKTSVIAYPTIRPHMSSFIFSCLCRLRLLLHWTSNLSFSDLCFLFFSIEFEIWPWSYRKFGLVRGRPVWSCRKLSCIGTILGRTETICLNTHGGQLDLLSCTSCSLTPFATPIFVEPFKLRIRC